MTQPLLHAISQITTQAPEDLRQLADQHLTDDNPRVRLACLQAITRLRTTTRPEAVRYQINDANKWIRLQVLRALIATIDEPEQLGRYIPAFFGDSEPLVRLEAVYAMRHRNLEPHILPTLDLEMLWDDEVRVWESRGERISKVMYELYGAYNPTTFKQLDDYQQIDAVPDDAHPSNSKQTTDQDLQLFEALDSDIEQADFDEDTTLPTWVDDLEDEASQLPEYSFDNMPDWLQGDVDVSAEDFANMVEDDSPPTDDTPSENTLPDWLRLGDEQDTGMIQLDIFYDEDTD